jgi:hypothetical protein
MVGWVGLGELVKIDREKSQFFYVRVWCKKLIQ